MSHRVITYGEPVLRVRAAPVTTIDDEVLALVEKLHWVIENKSAHAVAAPQVGYSLRVFLARLDEFLPDGSWAKGETYLFINPKLSNPSEETEVLEEGCLSIPGIRVPVERPVSITVEAQNLERESFVLHLSGLSARIIMHENDHLNGVLTIDRTPRRIRQALDQQIRALAKTTAKHAR